MLRLAKADIEAREQGRMEAEAMAKQFQEEQEYLQQEQERLTRDQ
jgi:hypothetical protein